MSKDIKIASLVTDILLNGWILPIGGVASGRVRACSLCSLPKTNFLPFLYLYYYKSVFLLTISKHHHNSLALRESDLLKRRLTENSICYIVLGHPKNGTKSGTLANNIDVTILFISYHVIVRPVQ